MHTKRAAKKSGKLRKLRRGFILLVLLIAIVVLVIYTLNSVGPVIVSVSEARIRALTTSAVNSAIFEVMTEPTKYSELITIQKDDAGNITLIEANAIVINNLAREMAKQTETYMEAIGEQVIKIPVGQSAAFGQRSQGDSQGSACRLGKMSFRFGIRRSGHKPIQAQNLP